MSDQAPPTGISNEDWAAPPPAVRGLVQELLKRLVEVAARRKQTSRNSSKPPSSDPPSAKPRPAQEPTGRKSGGQPGHEGHGRKVKPESEVDHRIEVRPESCEQWGTVLVGEDPEPERQQVTEVTPNHAHRDGIPAPAPALCRVWGEHPSAVARDDAAGEFWAARASHGGIFDGADRGQSARSAGHFSDTLSNGREWREYWGVSTGGACRVSHAGDGGGNVRAAPAGAHCRGDERAGENEAEVGVD